MAVSIKEEDIGEIVMKEELHEVQEFEVFPVDSENAPRDSDIIKFEITKVNIEEKEEFYECDLCKMTFNTQRKFKYHRNRHKTPSGNIKCLICKDTLSNIISFQHHLLEHEDKKGSKSKNVKICEVCGRKFQLKEDLEEHRRRLHYGNDMEKLLKANQKPLICDRCGKNFSEQKPYEDHIEEHMIKSRICKGCNIRFRSDFLYEHHPCNAQSGPLVCNFCGWGFRCEQSLHQHRLLHNRLKGEHHCPHCPKCFLKWKYLKAHILLHHPDTVIVLNRERLKELRKLTEPEHGEVWKRN